MTVLVTGGAGFVGSHLVEHLVATTDQEVVILDDLSSGSEANLDQVSQKSRVETVTADVKDAAAVERAVERADEVYHLAAAIGVKKIVEEPLASFETNVVGTENVLEAARKHGTAVFIASSSELYGKSTDTPFAEDDDRVLGPTTTARWSYATGKAADEFLALAYHDEYDLPVVIGRFFNVAGPRQSGQYGHVIPRFVRQALAGDPLTVYGDGTQTRSFTHVEDAVEVITALTSNPAANGEVYNVGAKNPVSINELAERVVERTGSDSSIQHIPLEEVYGEDFEEPRHRYPDLSKLEATLGTAPPGDLGRILDDVIAEYRTGRTTT